MLNALFAIGGIGLIAGIGLAIASKVFYVYVDPLVLEVGEALPGANCGGCGFAGCSGAADAIASGKAAPNVCVGGGSDVHVRVAAIMGVEFKEKEPEFAEPGCSYGTIKADLKFVYNGLDDCRAALLLNGGSKQCPIGCLGLGSCVKVCPFNALSIGPDKLPVVDQNACTGCGTCARICPKQIISLTSNARRIQYEYTTDSCSAPCQRSCPAGIDIPAYLRQIAEGRYREAVYTIKESNPFPSVCGRICVHPCEDACRRNLVDQPVAINNLKRFATDFEINVNQRVQLYKGPSTGESVAVIGGGAEGLTSAYFLNRLGHNVQVFESTSRLGGLLRIGLPENRLPEHVLDWDIQGILDAGVTANTNQRLGENISIESLLKQGFSAVLVTTGGWDTQINERANTGSLNPLPGVHLLVDFMLRQKERNNPLAGKKVLILGGGNSGLKTAVNLAENGAEKVIMVLRESRNSNLITDADVRNAEKQGVVILFRTALTKMAGSGNNLTQVEIARIPVNGFDGSREIIDIDTIITGTGRFPELIYVPVKTDGAEQDGVQNSESNVQWETISPYPGPYSTEDTGMFRPGEESSDYKAVVHAIGAGRRSASSVNKYLTHEQVSAPKNLIKIQTKVLNINKLEPVFEEPRQKMPERSSAQRINDPSAEIAMGYTEEQCLKEAARCLQCGLICYRRIDSNLN